jgi:hypothetical protein
MGRIALGGRGPKEAIQAGEFEIEQAADRHAAEAPLTPFFDPEGKRPRSEM